MIDRCYDLLYLVFKYLKNNEHIKSQMKAKYSKRQRQKRSVYYATVLDAVFAPTFRFDPLDHGHCDLICAMFNGFPNLGVTKKAMRKLVEYSKQNEKLKELLPKIQK